MIQDLLSLNFFGSFLLFAVITIAFIWAVFYSEYEEHGAIAFIAVVAYVLINYYGGNIPLIKLINPILIGLYVATGLVYAIIRTYFYGRSADNEIILKYKIEELKGHVFRWWFIWPVSLISWLISDFIIEWFELLWDNIGNTFHKILKAGYNHKHKENKVKE